MGDSLQVSEPVGYDFAYQRFREYATNWKAAKKCAYRERNGLKAKTIKSVARFTPRKEVRMVRLGGRSVRRVAVRVRGEVVGLDCGDVMREDSRHGEMESETAGTVGTARTMLAPSRPHSPSSVPDDYDDADKYVPATADHKPQYSPTRDLASESPTRSPREPRPVPLAPIAAMTIRPSFLGLAALFSICQQPNPIDLRTWALPIEARQTIPMEKNGRSYPTLRLFYKARLVEGVILLEIQEQRPKFNYKICPYGCMENGTHQWYSSSRYLLCVLLFSLFSTPSLKHRFCIICKIFAHLQKLTYDSVLSRHLRTQPPLTAPCPLYPPIFTTLTAHNIHTPLVERGVLCIYFKASKQRLGHYTSMYALSHEIFRLAAERGGAQCVRLWEQFKERPGQSAVDAMMRGYNVD